ncbi:hypothetical protein B0H19DRAFT_1379949 [Mycena capillaripes]|nr:hypothetical protein B0H19DRAFT_1379949 [Mycena capillaripes]
MNLQMVYLGPSASDSAAFFKIFERCSSALRSLQIHLHGDMPLPELTDDHVAMAIPLTSFRIAVNGETDLKIFPFLRPFTMSHLKALSITGSIDIDCHLLRPAMNTIEILSLQIQRDLPLSLSALPKLSFLRIATIPWLDDSVSGDIMRTLVSTIAPTHRIRTIMISFRLAPQNICDVFDTTLSSIIGLRAVHVETRGEVGNPAAGYFPQLSAKGILRMAAHNEESWGDAIEGL